MLLFRMFGISIARYRINNILKDNSNMNRNKNDVVVLSKFPIHFQCCYGIFMLIKSFY